MSKLFVPQSGPLDLAAFGPDIETWAATYAEGRMDDAFTPFIYPAKDWCVTPKGDAVMIGSAGVDGIQFAVRHGRSGIWMFHPYDEVWTPIADDIAQFEARWRAGQITE